jgi:hypothetical protein
MVHVGEIIAAATPVGLMLATFEHRTHLYGLVARTVGGLGPWVTRHPKAAAYLVVAGCALYEFTVTHGH